MRTPRRMVSLLAAALLGCVIAGLLAPAAPDAGTGDCEPASSWPAARADLANSVLAAVNAHRTAMGRRPLAVSPTLAAAAIWKARHMARYGYMSHDDPAPPVARSTAERIDACGYSGGGWGENIAEGFPSAQAVVQAWLASPGHRANIEQPGWAATGIGAAVAPNGAVYWSQEFGTSGGGAAPPPPAHGAVAVPKKTSAPTGPRLDVGRSLDRRAARVDRRYVLRFPVRAVPNGARVTQGRGSCAARAGHRHARILSAGFSHGFAQCILVAPRHTRGLHLTGVLRLRASHLQTRRWFSRRIR